MRSVGYAELFSLSKEDVLSAVKDYPEAEVNHILSLIKIIIKLSIVLMYFVFIKRQF